MRNEADDGWFEWEFPRPYIAGLRSVILRCAVLRTLAAQVETSMSNGGDVVLAIYDCVMTSLLLTLVLAIRIAST